MNDLCEVLCADFDDDSVVVFVSGKVVDDVEKKIENAVSKTVREFIDECVRVFFVRFVCGNALKTYDQADGDSSISLVTESVVRQLIDIVLDELGPSAGSGRTAVLSRQVRRIAHQSAQAAEQSQHDYG